jgi:periplasmic divalent cation tolerance protein
MSLKYPDEPKSAEFYKIVALFFMSVLLVLTNLPDRAAAEKLADALIAKQLAACVNILAPCRSVYRWKGAVQHDEEHPMLIKTTVERYAALEQAIRAGHPYELPEIIAVPVERGLSEYLDWVAVQTRAAETKA